MDWTAAERAGRRYALAEVEYRQAQEAGEPERYRAALVELREAERVVLGLVAQRTREEKVKWPPERPSDRDQNGITE